MRGIVGERTNKKTLLAPASSAEAALSTADALIPITPISLPAIDWKSIFSELCLQQFPRNGFSGFGTRGSAIPSRPVARTILRAYTNWLAPLCLIVISNECVKRVILITSVSFSIFRSKTLRYQIK